METIKMEKDIFESKLFVLKNIPSYESSLIKDYVEATLDISVVNVIILPFIKNRALVVLNEPLSDFQLAAKMIRNEKLDSQEITLLQTCQMPAVFVSDIDFSLLEEEFLKMYLEVTFAQCDDVISNCTSFPDYNVAVLHLDPEHQKVLKKILAKENHIPLPSEKYEVKISPFYKNFHDHIETQITKNKQIEIVNKDNDFKQENNSSKTAIFNEENKNNNFENMIGQNIDEFIPDAMINKKKLTTQNEQEMQSVRDIEKKEQMNNANNKDEVSDKETHTTSSDEHVMTDEEADSHSTDEHSVTDEEADSHSTDEHSVTDEEADSNDEEKERKSSSSKRATSIRGRVSGRTKGANIRRNDVREKATAEKSHTNSTDEEAESNSNDEDKEKKSSTSMQATSIRGRVSGRTKGANIRRNDVREKATAEKSHTNSTDEEAESNSNDEDKEKKSSTSMQATSIRGRVSGMTKGANIRRNDVREKATAEKSHTNSTDEEAESNSNDEDKEKKSSTSKRATSIRGRVSGRTKGANIRRNDVREKATAEKSHTNSTDEEAESNSNDEDKEKKSSTSKPATSIRGRVSGRTKVANIRGKDVREKATAEKNHTNSTDEEAESNSNDKDKDKKSSTSKPATSIRGRVSGMTKGANIRRNDVREKATAEKSHTNSTDEEAESNSNDEDKDKKSSTSKPATSIRGRVSGMTKGANIRRNDVREKATAEKSHTNSTDEEAESNSNDEDKEKKSSTSKRATSIRGRVSGRTKVANIRHNDDVRDKKAIGETHCISSDEQKMNKCTSSVRGTCFKSKGVARTKNVCDVKGQVTYQDSHSNSSEEPKKQLNSSSIKGTTTYRGRGKSITQTINVSENKSNSKKGTWNQDESNVQVSEEDKNVLSFQGGRGRNVGRGYNKVSEKTHLEKMEKSNYLSDQNESIANSTKYLSKKLLELQREKEKISEENARLKEEIHNIAMTELEAKCLQFYMQAYKECEVSYDSSLKAAILKGSHFKMQKCQSDIFLELKKVKENNIPLKKDVLSILSSEKGKTFLQNLCDSELKTAFLELDTESLKVAALDEKKLTEATKIIKDKVEYAETLDGKSDIPLEKIDILKLKIENKFIVKLNWDMQKAQLAILGIKDDVLAARKEIEIFLENYGVSEKSFDVGEPLAKYFSQFLEKDIQFILKPVKISDYSFTDSHISVRFQGNKMDATQALHKLEELKSHLKTLKWNLLDDFKAHEIFLIVSCVKYGNMKEIEAYMHKHNCLIDFSNVSSFQLLSLEYNTGHAKMNPKTTKLNLSHPTKSVSENLGHAGELIYTVTNTCQLVIKGGDIIQEKSDILVSVLGTDLNLKKTRVGGSFNRACPSHWREVNLSSENNPNTFIVTVKNPKDLSCLAVCHVIFEPWDPNASTGKLTSALQEVLKEAKLIGAKSISIPALGCGATFKFPPSNVAQIIFQAFLGVNIGSFLQKVVLLATDSDLSKELNHQATKYFKCLKLSSKPAKLSSSVTGPEEEFSDDNSDDSEEDILKIDDTSGNKNKSSTELVIMTKNENIESLKGQIKKFLTDHCLFTDYFNQDQIKYWPRDSRQKVVEKAKELSVWVARSTYPNSKNVGFLVKGEKNLVEKMLVFIQQEYMEISKRLPKKRLSSYNTTKRGTMEFMQYASESDEPFPSYWSLNERKSYWENIKSLWTTTQKRKHLIVDIDQETKDVIVNLVKKTFDPQLVKKDRDAQGLTHSSVRITNVQRVENVKLFGKYCDQRKTMFKKMLGMKKICPDIGKIQGSKGRVGTSKYLNDAMKKELFYEVNEHYLFYGTEDIEPVINFGLDHRNSSSDGLFGKGIYAAEISSLADVYTDSKDNRSPKGHPLTLILARVLLGNVFLCDDKHKLVQGDKKLSRPPCMSCLQERCFCHKQTLFDSVMGDGHCLYRQFVIYDGNQIYPEYIITYERV